MAKRIYMQNAIEKMNKYALQRKKKFYYGLDNAEKAQGTIKIGLNKSKNGDFA